jgi:hypothetical protein
VPLAVRERAQLAKAKRSGSRRRPTRLISRAGYAREQARSSPPDRFLFPRVGRNSSASPFSDRLSTSGIVVRPSRLGDITSGSLSSVRCAASLPPMRRRCLPCAIVRPGAQGAGAEGRPRTPSASPPAPTTAGDYRLAFRTVRAARATSDTSRQLPSSALLDPRVGLAGRPFSLSTRNRSNARSRAGSPRRPPVDTAHAPCAVTAPVSERKCGCGSAIGHVVPIDSMRERLRSGT